MTVLDTPINLALPQTTGIGESQTIIVKCNPGPAALGAGSRMTSPICPGKDKERKSMHRGYTFLWRKTRTNPVLQEKGKRFSRIAEHY